MENTLKVERFSYFILNVFQLNTTFLDWNYNIYITVKTIYFSTRGREKQKVNIGNRRLNAKSCQALVIVHFEHTSPVNCLPFFVLLFSLFCRQISYNANLCIIFTTKPHLAKSTDWLNLKTLAKILILARYR